MTLDLVETGSVAHCKHDCTDGMRVVSWNIARGLRFDEIAAFLADTKAEIICLQESDCNARRTNFRNVAAELAARLGANYAFGIEFEELAPGGKRIAGISWSSYAVAFADRALARAPFSRSIAILETALGHPATRHISKEVGRPYRACDSLETWEQIAGGLQRSSGKP